MIRPDAQLTPDPIPAALATPPGAAPFSLSESGLAAVLDALPSLVSYMDRDYRYRYVNQAYERWFGVTRAECLGSDMATVLGAAVFESVRARLDAAFAGAPQRFETAALYRRGGARHIQVDYLPDPDGQGGVRGVIAIVHDVTWLRASEAQFREVFEHVSVGIVKIDRDLRIVAANPASARIVGFEREALIGHLIIEQTVPEDQQRSLIARDRIFGSDVGVVFEKRLRHVDGREILVRISSHRLPVDRSGQRYALSVLEDVTESRRIHRELQDAHDQAISAGLARTQFLANMSHEIRTPLNGILGNLELIGTEGLSAEQRRSTEDALQSARLLLSLLNDILDFSKIDAGHLTLEPARFSLTEVIRSLQATYGSLFAEKGIGLRIGLDPGLPQWVIGDSLRVRQILNNLVSNALKFTGAGEVEVRAAPGAKDTVLVEVRDSGIGISGEAIGRLFTPFTQAEAGTTRRFGGTGLGLSISRQLARLMGGDIFVRSTVGEGATFTVSLPLVGCAPPADEPPVAGVEAAAIPPLRVLVVEDNAINQAVVRRQLERGGHAVTLAENGAEAVALVVADRFDVVLMDCQMPVMDGYEATRRIVAGLGAARPPIVALTANAFREDRERCYAAGMDHYLSKPFSRAALEQILAQVGRRGR